jgi:hypothetical protein
MASQADLPASLFSHFTHPCLFNRSRAASSVPAPATPSAPSAARNQRRAEYEPSVRSEKPSVPNMTRRALPKQPSVFKPTDGLIAVLESVRKKSELRRSRSVSGLKSRIFTPADCPENIWRKKVETFAARRKRIQLQQLLLKGSARKGFSVIQNAPPDEWSDVSAAKMSSSSEVPLSQDLQHMREWVHSSDCLNCFDYEALDEPLGLPALWTLLQFLNHPYYDESCFEQPTTDEKKSSADEKKNADLAEHLRSFFSKRVGPRVQGEAEAFLTPFFQHWSTNLLEKPPSASHWREKWCSGCSACQTTMLAFQKHLLQVFHPKRPCLLRHVNILLLLLVTPPRAMLETDWGTVVSKESFDVFARLCVNMGVFVPLLSIAATAHVTIIRQLLHVLIGCLGGVADKVRLHANRGFHVSIFIRALYML